MNDAPDPDRTLEQILESADGESEAVAPIIAASRLTADGEYDSKLGPDFDPNSPEWADAGERAAATLEFSRIVRPLLDPGPVGDELLPEN